MSSIRWERRAVKEFRRLPKELRAPVFEAVGALRQDPLKGEPLSGRWKGLRRLRVAAIRAIYGFDGSELLISVLRIGHRREVCRK